MEGIYPGARFEIKKRLIGLKLQNERLVTGLEIQVVDHCGDTGNPRLEVPGRICKIEQHGFILQKLLS